MSSARHGGRPPETPRDWRSTPRPPLAPQTLLPPPTRPAPAKPSGLPSPRHPRRRWLAALAWLPGQGVRRDVLIEADGERFTAVTASATQVPDGTQSSRASPSPGSPNAHSHAFRRALSITTQADRGTFWTWRERMYQVAERLDPDSYRTLARAVFAEMTLAGVSCVGEFHLLVTTSPTGARTQTPNAMGRAMIQPPRPDSRHAPRHSSPLGTEGAELAGPQRRFGDGDAVHCGGAGHSPGLRQPRHDHAGTQRRGDPFRPRPGTRDCAAVVAWARRCGAPLHVHMSEQRAENEACQGIRGCRRSAPRRGGRARAADLGGARDPRRRR